MRDPKSQSLLHKTGNSRWIERSYWKYCLQVANEMILYVCDCITFRYQQCLDQNGHQFRCIENNFAKTILLQFHFTVWNEVCVNKILCCTPYILARKYVPGCFRENYSVRKNTAQNGSMMSVCVSLDPLTKPLWTIF